MQRVDGAPAAVGLQLPQEAPAGLPSEIALPRRTHRTHQMTCQDVGTTVSYANTLLRRGCIVPDTMLPDDVLKHRARKHIA